MHSHRFALEGQDATAAHATPLQDPVLCAWRDQLAAASLPISLKHHLRTHEQVLLPCFAEQYTKLKALPRRMRRRLQRQWKRSLAGVALLMAMGANPVMAAIINVSGTCTVVDAITAANTDNAIGGCTAGSGADTIVLPTNSTQTLTLVNNSDLNGPSGLPVITSPITIDGNGSTIARSSASGTPDFRILALNSSGNLTLQETTVSGGKLSGNSAEYGGAVLNQGVLTLTNSTISGSSNASYYGTGGGVFNAGIMRLTNSTISGNATLGSFSYGGGVFNAGIMSLTNSTITDNSTAGVGSNGGGVLNGPGSTMTLTNSTLSGNSTSGGNAGGGGVYNHGILTLTNSTLSGNSTSGNNSDGGGVFNQGSLALTNSTITGNSTSGADSKGGGVYNYNTWTLTRTLVSGNTATGFLSEGAEIFSYNSVTTNAFNLFGHNGLTTYQALYSLPLGATDITATSDGTNPTPLAQILNTTLANNGGPTRTHALVNGSPAVDAVTTGCPPPNADQRGVTRPQGPFCDIGAFELQPGNTCAGAPATKVGTNASETINGTSGVDVILGLGGNDTINGLGGNDRICGNAGSDKLRAGPGSDIMSGGAGNDHMDGSTGTDTADYINSPTAVTANLSTNTATGEGSDTFKAIERLTGSRLADTLTGNDRVNVLSGLAGNDQLDGAGGNDTLNGGDADDAMNGGTGTDTCNGGAGSGDSQTACETITGVP